MISKIQNKSIELSLLLSLPATFALLIASEQIINCLFGYGGHLDRRNLAKGC